MQWSVNLIRQPYKIVKLICLRATVCLQYNLFIHSSKKSSTLECNFIVHTLILERQASIISIIDQSI